MSEPKTWNWNETIAYIMKAQGKSRRQATAELMEALRTGKLKATGILEGTDERVTIPPKAWPKIN
jgi:hypothetical protein